MEHTSHSPLQDDSGIPTFGGPEGFGVYMQYVYCRAQERPWNNSKPEVTKLPQTKAPGARWWPRGVSIAKINDSIWQQNASHNIPFCSICLVVREHFDLSLRWKSGFWAWPQRLSVYEHRPWKSLGKSQVLPVRCQDPGSPSSGAFSENEGRLPKKKHEQIPERSLYVNFAIFCDVQYLCRVDFLVFKCLLFVSASILWAKVMFPTILPGRDLLVSSKKQTWFWCLSEGAM